MKDCSVDVGGVRPVGVPGFTNHYQAQSRMEMSEDAHQQCLLLYPREPASCDQLKRAYEHDKAAYEKN